MEITLTKANKLRNKIENHFKSFAFETHASVSIFTPETASDKIKESQKNLILSMDKYSKLSEILSKIRQLISESNNTSGLNATQSQIAHVERLISLHKSISSCEKTPDERHITGVLENALKRNEDSHYGVTPTSVFPSVSEEIGKQSDIKLTELRRELDALEDTRSSINARNTIQISEGDVEFLRELRII